MTNLRIIQGDALQKLSEMPAESAHCCVTSPPYWGLRDYGVPGQMGLEKTPEEYTAKMVEVFREVRRLLRSDGTLWLNLADSYTSGGRKTHGTRVGYKMGVQYQRPEMPVDLKPKDLVGIPWRVALALQADGWYLRSDIIWSKPNPMPESVQDRPTKAHEYIFLLTKSKKYFYDGDAIKEKAIYREDERPFGDAGGNRHGDEGRTYAPSHGSTEARKARVRDGNKSVPTSERNGIRPLYKDAKSYDGKHSDKQRGHGRRHAGFNDRWDLMEKKEQCGAMRNKRSVWTIATNPYSEAHFATFPPDLIKPCILAGCPVGGTVLDPFAGSGTTGQVALEFGRKAVLIELNPEYIKLIEKRCAVTPGLAL